MSGGRAGSESRPLTAEEHALVRWMLTHGGPLAAGYLPQLDSARVVGRCPCGCASVDFGVGGTTPPAGEGIEVLADFQWRDAGGTCGVFAFARGGRLAGLEVWSIDGQVTPDVLPAPGMLTPLRLGTGLPS